MEQQIINILQEKPHTWAKLINAIMRLYQPVSVIPYHKALLQLVQDGKVEQVEVMEGLIRVYRLRDINEQK